MMLKRKGTLVPTIVERPMGVPSDSALVRPDIEISRYNEDRLKVARKVDLLALGTDTHHVVETLEAQHK